MRSLLKRKIEKVLRVLVGIPFWSIGRAGDLVWIQFGQRRRVWTRSGGWKLVGDFAIHLQCAWRIRNSSSLIVASGDVYFPPFEKKPSRAWRWDVGPNRFDNRVKRFLRERPRAIARVVRVYADDVGGLRVEMTKGMVLEVFPSDTLDGKGAEYWRFFRPSQNLPHFVVTNRGIKT